MSFDEDESYSTDESSSDDSDNEGPVAGPVPQEDETNDEMDLHISELISFDPFEPMFVIDALRFAREFGPGIFGDQFWAEHVEELGDVTLRDNNPVVEADKLSGMLLPSRLLPLLTESLLGCYFSGAGTLDVDALTCLILPTNRMKEAHILNGCYNFTKTNKVWTPL